MSKFWRWVLASMVVIVLSIIIEVSLQAILCRKPYYCANADIVFGLIFPLFYMLFYKGIPGKGATKGLFLGLLCWALFFLPLVFKWVEPTLSDFSLVIKRDIVVYFLKYLLGGVAIALIFGKSLEAEEAKAGKSLDPSCGQI